MIPPDFLNRQRIVLVETSHPGNVGGAARALKTMGLQHLHLVAPRFADVLEREEAIAFASGALDVLQQAKTHATLDSAIGDCQLTIALTSRAREYGPPVCDLHEAVQEAREYLQQHPQATVAWVLGSERYGLSNAQVQQCQRRCTIATNLEYPSLNLAQAVQLIAYECRRQMSDAPIALTVDAQPRATQSEIEQLRTHLEQAMIAVEFLNPQQPKKLLPRLQQLFARADLRQEEIHILRGLCRAMIETADKSVKGEK
ncbi:MAG: RNA methyltransferase [Burkholderiaceae bacterium]|nr:MAG: RNA methyltransferase [Burkholderiaceae bacterium]